MTQATNARTSILKDHLLYAFGSGELRDPLSLDLGEAGQLSLTSLQQTRLLLALNAQQHGFYVPAADIEKILKGKKPSWIIPMCPADRASLSKSRLIGIDGKATPIKAEELETLQLQQGGRVISAEKCLRIISGDLPLLPGTDLMLEASAAAHGEWDGDLTRLIAALVERPAEPCLRMVPSGEMMDMIYDQKILKALSGDIGEELAMRSLSGRLIAGLHWRDRSEQIRFAMILQPDTEGDPDWRMIHGTIGEECRATPIGYGREEEKTLIETFMDKLPRSWQTQERREALIAEMHCEGDR